MKPGEKTLLASVVLSSPGPIVVGIGLLLGRSSTQLADFVRRTAELAAIIISWIVFRMTQTRTATDKGRLERIAGMAVGGAMCCSGAAMLLLTFLPHDRNNGNVIPGLVIAVLGVISNCFFWLRYRKLNRDNPNAILLAQNRLYLAKTLVDTCVTAALTTVAIAPGSIAAHMMDFFGSVAVAVYLIVTGVITLFRRQTAAPAVGS